jgi:hypothetical protein
MVAGLSDISGGGIILAGGEILLDPVREPVLYPAIAQLREKYKQHGGVELIVQTTGDILNDRTVRELLARDVDVISVSGMDAYHKGLEEDSARERLRRRLETIFRGVGMSEWVPAPERQAGARVAIQGFGAVGKHAARFLSQKNAILMAASDSAGTLVDDSGLDVAALIALKDAGRPLHHHSSGRKLDGNAILDVECDIWIPAARPDVVRADNVNRLKTRLMPQGANIPCTPEAEKILHERGVLIIPDFIANAGGIICAATEYRGGTEHTAFDDIDKRIRSNTRDVIEESRRTDSLPRVAALGLARRRLHDAMQTRRWR